jgi:hypothetical protein
MDHCSARNRFGRALAALAQKRVLELPAANKAEEHNRLVSLLQNRPQPFG